jgi:hypothetical protein
VVPTYGTRDFGRSFAPVDRFQLCAFKRFENKPLKFFADLGGPARYDQNYFWCCQMNCQANQNATEALAMTDAQASAARAKPDLAVGFHSQSHINILTVHRSAFYHRFGRCDHSFDHFRSVPPSFYILNYLDIDPIELAAGGFSTSLVLLATVGPTRQLKGDPTCVTSLRHGFSRNIY